MILHGITWFYRPDPAGSSKIHQNLTTDAEFHGDVDFTGPNIDIFDKKHEKSENT